MTRTLTLTVLALTALLCFACAPEAPDNALQPAMEAAKAPAKAPSTPPAASKTVDRMPFERSDTGRDPFASTIEGSDEVVPIKKDGFSLRGWLASSRLTGIVSGTGVPRAMLTDAAGHGHILKEGDLFKDGSRLVAIRSDEVEFEVTPSFMAGGASEALEGQVERPSEALVVRLHRDVLAMGTANSPLMGAQP